MGDADEDKSVGDDLTKQRPQRHAFMWSLSLRWTCTCVLRIAKASRVVGTWNPIQGGTTRRCSVEFSSRGGARRSRTATPTIARGPGRTTEPLWGICGRVATAAPNRNLNTECTS